jgi:hypothetical protein
MRHMVWVLVATALMVVVMGSTALVASAQDPALGDWPTGASGPGCEDWWSPDYQDFGADGVWIHWYQNCPGGTVWDGWYGPM